MGQAILILETEINTFETRKAALQKDYDVALARLGGVRDSAERDAFVARLHALGDAIALIELQIKLLYRMCDKMCNAA